MPQPEQLIVETIRMLVARRGEPVTALDLQTHLYDDLDLASLEAAELSSILEDALGSDPYSQGQIPQTVAEIVAFYDV